MSAIWDEAKIERLGRYYRAGMRGRALARALGVSESALHKKLAESGIAERRLSRAERRAQLAEALCETGDVALAAVAIGVGRASAFELFREIRRELGWQAR